MTRGRAEDRLDALSVPEMRRLVDVAVGYVREMRRALAVDIGMRLEDAPGPRPQIDTERMQQVVEELLEMLPVLREPLTPEERKKLRPISRARVEQQREVLDEILAHPKEFDALMEEGGEAYRHGDIVRLRENLEKTEMLREVEREVQALLEEMRLHKERLEADVAALLAGKGSSS